MKRKSVFISFVQVYFAIFIVFTVLLLSCSDPTAPESSVPKLTTATISTITSSTANCGVTITSNGGETVTACGVCWSTSQSPTVSDNKTNGGAGAGNFISKISGLTPETEYYVRAYATNSVGTGYGSAVSFTTFKTGTGMVTDIDGNLYQVIKIGNQWWMAENLKVTHYRNGVAIPNVTDRTEWITINTGAYCNYNNHSGHVTTYGLLYNWYAVDDSRIIEPEGWHVPTDEEWQELEMYLGMSQSEASGTQYRGTDEGGKMKEVGTAHWNSPNTGATNESGFTALPYGGRTGYNDDIYRGNYWWKDVVAIFWSSSVVPGGDGGDAWLRHLSYTHTDIRRAGGSKRDGYSVRCVMD